MPKSAEELVKLKLGTLRGKLLQAVEYVQELESKADYSSEDSTSLNLVLDNLHCCTDELFDNFKAASPSKKTSEEMSPTSQDTPIQSPLDTKPSDRYAASPSKQTSGEMSPTSPDPPLPSPSDTKPSDRHDSLKSLSDRQGSFQQSEQIIQNNGQSVGQEASPADKMEKLESNMRVIACHNAELEKRLKCVEQQRTKIVEKICALDNQNSSAVAFGVYLKHKGPWKNGATINEVECVDFNVGNAFQQDRCQFCVPTEGLYCLILYAHIICRGMCKVELWTFNASTCDWNRMICSVCVNAETNNGKLCDVVLVHLQEGDSIRLRVYGGVPFHQCNFQGWMVSKGSA